MPLTDMQKRLGRMLAVNRSEDSYLAGGAAILAAPNSKRYSQDLDFFHDSTSRVASAFAEDKKSLEAKGFDLTVEINQPGHIRAMVSDKNSITKIEWAQDSTWRFMPVIKSRVFGFQLHPVDLATNKLLALAGREEPRDLLDTLYLHKDALGLGPLVWASVGKDPGFSPQSLLELLKRRGKVRPEDLSRLHLSEVPDVQQLKTEWMEALRSAGLFIKTRPQEEVGCLYFSASQQKFVDPSRREAKDAVPHFGRPGGVLPRFVEGV